MMLRNLHVCLIGLAAVGCSDGTLGWSSLTGSDGSVMDTDCHACDHLRRTEGGSNNVDAEIPGSDATVAELDQGSGGPVDATAKDPDGSVPEDLRVVDARVDPVDARVDPGSTITVSDNVTDEGRSCIRIETRVATYLYDKEGAGFTSLIDRDGNDWISWQPGGGSGGEYRGIPNLGNCCHPGYDSANSEIVASEGDYAKIRSTGVGSDSKPFEVIWEFFPDHATLTIVKAPSSYYMLYEGTPGGKVGEEDFFVYAVGASTRAKLMQGGEPITEDLPGPEWIYFEDSKLGRALLLVHREDDRVGERYWTMNSEMTVFGFGRTGHGASMGLTAAPQHLSIALLEQVTFDKASDVADALMP